MKQRIWIGLMLLCLHSLLMASPSPAIPESLVPWEGWVLKGYESQRCPIPYNKSDTHFCVWPTALTLSLKDNQGQFEQRVVMYTRGFVSLPGSQENYPYDIKVNSKSFPVIAVRGVPSLFLEPGEYVITGLFSWEALPENLNVPRTVGLLSVKINENVIEQPNRDQTGKVWIRQRLVEQERKVVEDSVTLKVFRLIDDTIPQTDTTLLRISVTGKPREIHIDKVLYPGSVLETLHSPIPAQLTEEGTLRCQVQAGQFDVMIKSRYLKQQDSFSLVNHASPWPTEEIWSFHLHPNLRVIDFKGGVSLDPKQTDLPQDWWNYPAFLMKRDNTLSLVEKRRAQLNNRLENLSLHRKLWLDFSGAGYTVQDTLTGNIEQHWRLSQVEPYVLKHISLNGQDKVITQISPEGKPGVDIRWGNIDVESVSRIEERQFTLPAVGWDVDLQSLSTTLFLPPGWLLLGTKGVDTSEAWFQKWSLLDLFLVLVVAAALTKMLGKGYGVIAAIALGLTYHEPGSSIKLWINLIAAVALLRVLLPEHRLYRWVRVYTQASFVLLVVALMPFAVQQLRNALYPQLSIRPYYEPVATMDSAMGGAMEDASAPSARRSFPKVMGAALSEPANEIKPLMKGSMMAVDNQEEYDPSEKIQAGPGVPQWQWNAHALSWNGPVLQSQTMTLWLLPRSVSSILNVIEIIFMAFLLFGLAQPLKGGKVAFHRGANVASFLVATLMAFLMMGAMGSSTALADYPSDALLTELRSRLIAPPECLPHCADVNRMQVMAAPNQLTLRLSVQAAADISIPLPSLPGKWIPRSVLIDNLPATQMLTNQQLWLHIPQGVHEVIVEGPLGELNRVDIPIPLTPKEVVVSQDGWQVEGIINQKLQGQTLSLTRMKTVVPTSVSTSSTLGPSDIPAFVLITRTFDLGIEWTITTHIQRIAPQGSPIALAFPLLEGESVISDNVQVNNNQVMFQLGASQSMITYRSKLNQAPSITLKALENAHIKEIWQWNAQSKWYCQFEGIPLISQKNQMGQWMPTWEPWPNETVKVLITRPKPIAGNTLSIDNSLLQATPGKEASLYELRFTARSTEGTQYQFSIPNDAELQDIQVDETSQPITMKQGKITIPLNPGIQEVFVKWQERKGLNTFYQTPAVNLTQSTSNVDLKVAISQKERWILWVGGPAFGPAILFWGVLAVILLIAGGIARSGYTPLKMWEWLLLAMGITLATPMAGIIIIAWFVAMQKRKSMQPGKWLQTGLVFLSFLFVVSLFTSISQGLLDVPSMQLKQPYFMNDGGALYSPTHYLLRWYQDNANENLPHAWIISVPLTVYRILMLIWALWLAFSLVKWMRWGWKCFSEKGYWP